ncbi:MAG: T9SS type A sorting domain-containing protein [Flavobacteriales bacterium]|nr:T9SS type A sorting domain-containing protein [Flavobacteriales bacterium]
MNKICVFVFLISCFSHSIYSQYHPTLLESQVWKGVTYGWGVFDFYQKVQGDSLIGEEYYMKIYSGQGEDQMDYMVGLLREDEAEQRIYIWTGSEEHLIYDFDVEAGDVVSSWGVGTEQNITVTSVETLTIDGTSRKKINFNDQWGAAYWIEGMGSIYGLIDGALGNIVDYNPVMTCLYQNNNLIWDNPLDEGNCDATLSIDETRLSTMDYYPNPFTTNMRINFNGPTVGGNAYLRVYDVMGVLVFEMNVNSSMLEMDGLTFLSSGLYTMSWIQNGNHVASGRIMKL